MLDRHAVHALLQAGDGTKKIAKQYGVSQRTIQRIAKEPAVDEPEDAAARRRRGVGRPSVEEAVRLRLRDLLVADPVAPPLCSKQISSARTSDSMRSSGTGTTHTQREYFSRYAAK